MRENAPIPDGPDPARRSGEDGPADTLRTRFANNYRSHFSVRESQLDMSNDSNATNPKLLSLYRWVVTA